MIVYGSADFMIVPHCSIQKTLHLAPHVRVLHIFFG